MVLCGDLALRIRSRSKKLGDAAFAREPHFVVTRQSRLFRAFIFGLGLTTILIFWRCVYRVVELNDGFSGPITFKQGLFIGFEGVLIVVAASTMAILHPAVCMGDAYKK